MEKFLLISSFRHLNIDGTLQAPFTLLPGIDITNQKSKKNELLADQNIVALMGLIEANHLLDSPNIVFCEFDEKDLGNLDLEKSLLLILLWIKGLFRSAWVLSDHNLECDAAYLFKYEHGQLERGTSNFLAQHITRADCSKSETTLDFEALKKWERLHDNISSYLHMKNSSDLRFFMEKGYCRIGRAFQFIDNARAAPNTSIKIAHYMSAFEALFSTSSAELSHKLSERVAFFLSEYGKSHTKIEVFKNIKTAYEIRSKLVHGDNLPKGKIGQLPEVSSTCYSYLREIMQIMFGDQSLKEQIDVTPEKLDNFFEQMIFG